MDRYSTRAIHWLLATLVLSMPVIGMAQPAQLGDAGPPEARGAGEATSRTGMAQDITRIKGENALIHEESEAIKKENERNKQEIQKLSKRLDDLEKQQDLSLEGEGPQGFKRTFDIYGFFDLNLFYYDIDDKYVTHGIFPSSLSFMVDRLNLYFASQMTETLSVLAEIRLTFLPQGQEKTFDIDVLGMDYQRTDTSVFDSFTGEEFNLGGLAIERVHLTWRPYDFFGVLAGRFLTPFGIWNVDHGSPVLIPVRPPYFMVREMIPLAQTGVELFGRYIPGKNIYLDYAVTLSNGRGPTEEVYDLDNNKALGLRLKGAYEGKEVTAALGGYLYWGDTTDVLKRLDSLDPIHLAVETTERYTEITGSLDLLLQFYHVRLQGEFVRGKVTYSTRPIILYPIIHLENFEGGRQPDYIKWAAYGLLGYEIPFKTEEGELFLTPFAMYEYNVFDDSNPEYTVYTVRGGLNFKPSQFVTVKYEATWSRFPEAMDTQGQFWLHSVQLAVSF